MKDSFWMTIAVILILGGVLGFVFMGGNDSQPESDDYKGITSLKPLNNEPDDEMITDMDDTTDAFITFVNNDPCKDTHEIEMVDGFLTIDWGPKGCRIYVSDDFDRILGFRSDGVLVWRTGYDRYNAGADREAEGVPEKH